MQSRTHQTVLDHLERLQPGIKEVCLGYFSRRGIRAPSCWTMRELATTILPRIPKQAPIIDIGCGSGAWLCELWDRGYRQLYGIDVENQVQIENLERSLVVAGVCATLSRWNVREGLPGVEYHLVTAFDMLSDAGLDPREFFEIITPHVEIGGWLAFDWYMESRDKPRRRSFGPVAIGNFAIEQGFRLELELLRNFQRRKIGFYVFKRVEDEAL